MTVVSTALASLWSLLHEPQTWAFITIGFIAQLSDGAFGMGFGAVSSTVLAALGVPREIASATVNGAKLVTGVLSGVAHMAFRNIDWPLFVFLTVSGCVGGWFGATLMTFNSSRWVGVVVSVYLLVVGGYIIWRASHDPPEFITRTRITGIGLAGGFLEAVSGVWGPLVTSNLVAHGASPRHAVGTGNLSETFVAITVFAVLVHHIGFAQLSGAMIGLLIGAVVGAPIGASFTRRLPRKVLAISVGVIVILMSLLRLTRDLIVFNQ